MTEYLPYITGSGGALAVLVVVLSLLLSGKLRTDREVKKLEGECAALLVANDKLTTALDTERRTLNETVAAGQVTNQLIAALTTVATGKAPALSPPVVHGGATTGGAAP